jgi:hypothetical protein
MAPKTTLAPTTPKSKSGFDTMISAFSSNFATFNRPETYYDYYDSSKYSSKPLFLFA